MLTALLFAAFSLSQPNATLVETKPVWDRSPKPGSTDLVRFKDRWAVVCSENSGTADASLRVLTSADGVKWEAARITSPTPERGLSGPKLTVTPEGRLVVTALGTVPPVPMYGGTVRTMTWTSADGREWGDHEPLGPEHFPLGRTVWHKGVRYSYGHGVICGSMQTVKVFGGASGKPLGALSEQTFSGFFPGAGALVFDGETAHCLMTRYGVEGVGNPLITGYAGTSKHPYKAWEWKELGAKIASPNLLRLADGRVVAAVGLFDGKARTALCDFDPAAGKLTELLELPGGGVGLAEHDGHVWVSYQSGGKVHLAKVKLGRR